MFRSQGKINNSQPCICHHSAICPGLQPWWHHPDRHDRVLLVYQSSSGQPPRCHTLSWEKTSMQHITCLVRFVKDHIHCPLLPSQVLQLSHHLFGKFCKGSLPLPTVTFTPYLIDYTRRFSAVHKLCITGETPDVYAAQPHMLYSLFVGGLCYILCLQVVSFVGFGHLIVMRLQPKAYMG